MNLKLEYFLLSATNKNRASHFLRRNLQMKKYVCFCFQIETHILERKKEDFCLDFQFHQNSQKTPEFFIQAEAEELKLSDFPVTSQRGGAPNHYNSSPEESR